MARKLLRYRLTIVFGVMSNVCFANMICWTAEHKMTFGFNAIWTEGTVSFKREKIRGLRRHPCLTPLCFY